MINSQRKSAGPNLTQAGQSVMLTCWKSSHRVNIFSEGRWQKQESSLATSSTLAVD